MKAAASRAFAPERETYSAGPAGRSRRSHRPVTKLLITLRQACGCLLPHSAQDHPRGAFSQRTHLDLRFPSGALFFCLLIHSAPLGQHAAASAGSPCGRRRGGRPAPHGCLQAGPSQARGRSASRIDGLRELVPPGAVPTATVPAPPLPALMLARRVPPLPADMVHAQALLRGALEELELARGQEERRLVQAAAALRREYEASMQALERRFLSDAEGLQVSCLPAPHRATASSHRQMQVAEAQHMPTRTGAAPVSRHPGSAATAAACMRSPSCHRTSCGRPQSGRRSAARPPLMPRPMSC